MRYYSTDTMSFSASGLPSGLSMNTSTGVISGNIADDADTDSPYSGDGGGDRRDCGPKFERKPSIDRRRADHQR